MQQLKHGTYTSTAHMTFLSQYIGPCT